MENSHFSGFYDEMIRFIRSLFESALKTNNSLEFGIVTGCLRISKESIFTGLNNLDIISILDENYAEYFGFTESEVKDMLGFYEIAERFAEVKEWYDGYLFGQTEVYNPWSVIKYVQKAVTNKIAFPEAYWSNTSSNDIVKNLIEHADMSTKTEIENLIDGGAIEKVVHEEITYDDINFKKKRETVRDKLWNFLLFTGYLKADGVSFDEDTSERKVTMKIPNTEVRLIYRNSIINWFDEEISTIDFEPMYKAVFDKDFQTFEDGIQRIMAQSISCNDSLEAFYHGMMMGIMRGLEDYQVLSNRESGNGRPDLLIKPVLRRMPTVIMEFKYVKTFREMDEVCDSALKQIEDEHYADGLLYEGYENIIKYGICFCKKSCRVKLGE